MQNISLGFRGLLRHCWKTIWKGSFSQGRISRGEYWVSILILSALSGLVTLVLWLVGSLIFMGGINPGSAIAFMILTVLIGIIIPLIIGIFQVKLIIKRAHDLGKSGRYPFVPMLLLLGLGIIGLIIGGTTGLFELINSPSDTVQLQPLVSAIMNNKSLWVVGILGIIVMIWSMIRGIYIAFWKGMVGDNQYGGDPLTHQPTSNRSYRLLGVVLLVLNIGFSFFSAGYQTSLVDDSMMDEIDMDSISGTLEGLDGGDDTLGGGTGFLDQ
ncbi:MAG TPA: DUF805 domain-containing protein [Candidatus Absconditabacterales bacterium]|nr:DUF805 domain-containing protein [Candidatus Absconditabacterales bacterium]HNG97336.1 DUF805 domain-containing protein [Candidatus Absconditabacterales bacterium]